MHIDVYVKDPTDTLTIKYPPGWRLQTQVTRAAAMEQGGDPLDFFDRMDVRVQHAASDAYNG